MRRKYYKYDYERKADRKAGFFSFPFINGVVGYATWVLNSGPQPGGIWGLILQCVANGLILLLAFIFRPEFAVGYLTFISAAITAVFFLCFLFVGGCYIAGLVGLITGPLAPIVAIVVYLAILFSGLGWWSDQATRWYDNWTFAYDDPKHQLRKPSNQIQPGNNPDAISPKPTDPDQQPDDGIHT